MIHGGLDSTIEKLPKEEVFSRLSRAEQRRYESLLRTRWIKPCGETVRLADVTDADVFWAKTYDGRLGHAYFGHQAFKEASLKQFPHATGVDLGVVYGGYLAAAVLSIGARPTQILISARKAYVSRLDANVNPK